MSVKERFKELRLTLELSQKKMASDLGMTYIMIQKYEYGQSPLSDATLLKLKNIYNVNIDWLINGNGSMFLNSKGTAHILKIPYYKEVSAAAGSGALVYDENSVEYINIPSALIKITYSNNISIINAVGDSMYPVIDNNDMIILDLGEKQLRSEGIYLIRIDDTLLVKRLQKIPNGVLIISDNPKYEPIKITLDDYSSENHAIIGKVISVIKNFGR